MALNTQEICMTDFANADFDTLTPTQVNAFLDAVDNDEVAEDHPLLVHIESRVRHFSAAAGEAMEAGGDYLPVLTPSASATAVDMVAMDLVLAALEEAMDEAEE